MVRIRLFCTAGMSTSMLVSKMRKTARDKGIDVEISCYPVTSLQSQIDDADVVLLGPLSNDAGSLAIVPRHPARIDGPADVEMVFLFCVGW